MSPVLTINDLLMYNHFSLAIIDTTECDYSFKIFLTFNNIYNLKIYDIKKNKNKTYPYKFPGNS